MSDQQSASVLAEGDDPELERIVAEEEATLARVLLHLKNKMEQRQKPKRVSDFADYETQMLALRDEIACARLEDVPPLLEQMERLQSLASRRRDTTEGFVDARSPYFGHLVLEENGRRREVLIGRGTYLDTEAGVRIVDWRDAPVSRLFYRYDEGDDYDEIFGEREIEGEVITRRSVSIVEGEIRRIVCPQGSFGRNARGEWRRLGASATALRGGQGTAARAEQQQRPGQLGTGDTEGHEDRHLREITALIDKRQFELITQPDSGLVVIQGGAGSGKTTIGLHRLAYLAYQDKRRFRADRMLVVVFNDALARYIAQVLPALDVPNVAIRTYQDWANKLRTTHLPALPRRTTDETPGEVTRLKKHPAMLKAIEERVHELEQKLGDRIEQAVADSGAIGEAAIGAWHAAAERPVVHRLHAVRGLIQREGAELPTDARVALERVVKDGISEARDVMTAWAELVSDRKLLGSIFARHAPGEFSEGELDRAHAWCSARCELAVVEAEERIESGEHHAEQQKRRRRRDSERPERRELGMNEGVDGASLEERSALDHEDDTLLLRLYQRLVGPLKRGAKAKEALVYEHVLVDEAQDLSPVELAVVLDTVSGAQSVTLAGDVSQRLHMDNGFTNWNGVLGELGLSHVEVEPLRISYRSTQEIIDLARDVLGPLADEEEGVATRHGAPVELFRFAHGGDAVGFLAEALRDLMHAEPRASVAVISRYVEQADLYFDGLEKGEVPRLRRIAEQDFPFKPGVDVTDVRQVKGLEFDYVVLVDVNESSYPEDDEARHLLHIAATRAAHQLWVVATGAPSRLLPAELVERGY